MRPDNGMYCKIELWSKILDFIYIIFPQFLAQTVGKLVPGCRFEPKDGISKTRSSESPTGIVAKQIVINITKTYQGNQLESHIGINCTSNQIFPMDFWWCHMIIVNCRPKSPIGFSNDTW